MHRSRYTAHATQRLHRELCSLQNGINVIIRLQHSLIFFVALCKWYVDHYCPRW